MRLRSDSFEHRGRIPAEFAMGTPDGFGGNRNPHLAWDGRADGHAIVRAAVHRHRCADRSRRTAGRDDVEIPVEHPRGEFVHWVMVDIPASVQRIDAGSCSDGITQARQADAAGPARRAPGPQRLHRLVRRRRRHARRLLRLRRPVSAVQRPAPASLFLPPVRAARAERSTCRTTSPPPMCSMRCSRT